MVDRGGDAASLETFPEGVGEVKPEAGLLVRTNHFVSAEGEPGCQGGVARRQLVGPARPPGRRPSGRPRRRTRPTYSAAMTHHDPAGSVCRHAEAIEDPDDEWLDTATLATVTLDVERGTLSVLRGGPCQR